MAILFEFLMRLAFGLSFAMLITSPVQVTAGFFRNHLYVILGISVLAFLLTFGSLAGGLAATAAVLSYAGSICYLYQAPRLGRVSLGLLAIVTLLSLLTRQQVLFGDAAAALSTNASGTTLGRVLWLCDGPTGGLLLGTTVGAMLLGHWYLNTPTMQMAPLRRLLAVMVFAIGLRMLVCGTGLAATLAIGPLPAPWFVVLRWLTGLVAPLVMAWMVERTLRIPNTQSATGILYVAAVMVFTGELMSQLLSVTTAYPL